MENLNTDSSVKFSVANLTEEQRKEMYEKARISREEKKKAGEHLKNDFLDEGHWRELASQVGFRLAAKHIPCSETKYIKRLLNHLGKEADWWKENNGYNKFSSFAKDNPDWPAFAAQGLVLEDYFNEKE
ncbi:hypothetical protein D3C85_292890 [compost metagenome]